jgi:hypothetical protein
MIQQDGNHLATYRCLHCQTARPFGHCGDESQPLLSCVTCHGPSRHEFTEVNQYTSVADVDVSGKISSIEFARTSRIVLGPALQTRDNGEAE